MEIWYIFVQTNTGCYLAIKDVRHVPNICLNLISTRLLDDNGYTSVFGGGKLKLIKSSLIVFRGKKENTLYITNAKYVMGAWMLSKKIPQLSYCTKGWTYEWEETSNSS